MDSGSATAAVCRKRSFFLAFLWILGFVLGIVRGEHYTYLLAPDGTRTFFVRVSYFKTAFVLAVPFLLSLVGALIHMPVLIYVVAFLDAAAYAIVFTCVIICFPVSGWFVSWLLLFSKIAIQIFQFVFYRSCLTMDLHSVFREFLFYIVIILSAVALDYRFVSPILSEILNRF